MTALLEYLDLLRNASKASRQKRIGYILKVSMIVSFLVRTCIDKQLACKLFLFTTAGANSSWHVQIGFVHKRL